MTTVQDLGTPPTTRGIFRILRLFLTVVIALLVLYLTYSLVGLATFGHLIQPLEVGGLPATAAIDLPAGARILEADFMMKAEAGFGQRLMWWLVTDLIVVFGLGFLILLRKIIAKGTEPFTPENAVRLRWMGLITLATALLSVLRPVVSEILQGEFGLVGFSASFVDVGDFGLAILIFGLLEIWRHGIALKSEQELTV